MDTSTDTKLFKDTLISMTNMGAEYVKTKDNDIFFWVNKDSELNDLDKLRGCRDFLKSEFGLTLRVYYRK